MCKVIEKQLEEAGIVVIPASNRMLQKQNITINHGCANIVRHGKEWILLIRLSNGNLKRVKSPQTKEAKDLLEKLKIPVSDAIQKTDSRRGNLITISSFATAI
jgi:hypothetical protein